MEPRGHRVIAMLRIGTAADDAKKFPARGIIAVAIGAITPSVAR